MRKLSGKALALALLGVAIPSCSSREETSANGQSAAADAGIEWNGQSEKQLRESIANAPAHGLKPELFLKGDAQDAAALTQAALRYAGALASGYVDPVKIREVYTVPRSKMDVRAGLAQALRNGNVGQWLNSLAPQTDEYRALSRAFLQYLKQAQAAGVSIPAGDPIKPGRGDDRMPQIVAALTASGYLPPPGQNAAPPTRYSPAVVAAVKQLQADWGMKPDGVVGEDTINALNAGPAGRARQIAVAMERLRWLDRNPPKTRIDVNTAAAFLDYWRDGNHVVRRNVVVGEPGWETPQLGTPMFQLVANPIWRVPDSIIEDEIGEKSAAWLAANGFQTKDGRLVQMPGPKNSLGVVKFDLRNKEQIYLHDTPAKALFAMPERHRSHGCVRVQNALQFAQLIAQQDGIADRFSEALESGDETYVKLKTEIPVRLLYHTAFWNGSRIQFRPDPYGWDEDVAYAIGFVRGPPRKRHEHRRGEDIGP
jgi:murein L,D-transpeptidase YcbB/YkuD